MSDFDEVLERMLNEPLFAAELAADPLVALAGYRLDPEEADLLRRQFAPDDAATTAVVEARITKSSTFGLVTPMAGIGDALFGATSGTGPSAAAAAEAAASTATPSSAHLGRWSEFGTVAGLGARNAAELVPDPGAADSGMGPADTSGSGAGELVAARTGLGDAPDLDGLPAVSQLGDAPVEQLGNRQAEIPDGYRNRVDVDGDDRWDRSTYRAGDEGGVDILVDLDGDGRTDFIGHDIDADRTVDYADYDKNHDGVFEQRQYDTDGDGLLDRTVWRTE